MANRVPILFNPLNDAYPDDDTDKPVYLQADGQMTAATDADRHVLLRWVNHIERDEATGTIAYITQIVQLSGGPGNYAFKTPTIERQSARDWERNKSYPLGILKRPQRDRIIEIARGLNFNMKTRDDSCRTWTRLLFVAMLAEGLLDQETFDLIDKDVPLKKPKVQ